MVDQMCVSSPLEMLRTVRTPRLRSFGHRSNRRITLGRYLIRVWRLGMGLKVRMDFRLIYTHVQMHRLGQWTTYGQWGP